MSDPVAAPSSAALAPSVPSSVFGGSPSTLALGGVLAARQIRSGALEPQRSSVALSSQVAVGPDGKAQPSASLQGRVQTPHQQDPSPHSWSSSHWVSQCVSLPGFPPEASAPQAAMAIAPRETMASGHRHVMFLFVMLQSSLLSLSEEDSSSTFCPT